MELLTRMRAWEGYRVGLYCADIQPFDPGALAAALGPDVGVFALDESFLCSFEGMQPSFLHLLVVPELDQCSVSAIDRVKEYAQGGGALVASLREFAMSPAETDVVLPFTSARLTGEQKFRRTVAYLGLKPYESDITPSQCSFDAGFLPDCSARIAHTGGNRGVTLVTGSERYAPHPPFGHVFPERSPALRAFEVVSGLDPCGGRLAALAVLGQNMETGCRMVALADSGPGSLLRCDHAEYAAFWRGARAFLDNRAFLCGVSAQYPCLRWGEPVTITAELVNTGDLPVSLEVRVAVAGNSDAKWHSNITVPPHAAHSARFYWRPERYDRDLVEFTATLECGGQLLSRAENAVVLWNPVVAKNGPSFAVRGGELLYEDEPRFVLGANYYESSLGEGMWMAPNVAALARDLRAMSEAGMRYVRIHYHHAKWFADYWKRVVRAPLPAAYARCENTPLPDEHMLRCFDAHIYLCQKYRLVYGGDLFTLLPEELGDPRGWFGVGDYLLDEKFGWQQRFLQMLIPRYVGVPGIAWDLYNEPEGVDAQRFARWSARIAREIRALGDTHAITVGGSDPQRFPVSDFYADHQGFRAVGKNALSFDRAAMAQEVWMDRPPTREGDAQQAEDMRYALLSALSEGLRGFAPWQWTNQSRLWGDHRAYPGEIWDDQLGACVRSDGTEKPAGRWYRHFARLIAPLCPENTLERCIELQAGELRLCAPDEGSSRALLALQLDGRAVACIALEEATLCGFRVSGQRDQEIWLRDGGDGGLLLRAGRPGVLTIAPVEKAWRTRPMRATLENTECDEPLHMAREGWRLNFQSWHMRYWIRVGFADR